MLFKNARIFRFTRPVQMDPEQLEAKLADDSFKPCGPQEVSRQGWVSPLGKHGETLVHAAGGYMLICLQKQEKILPAPVVKEFVEERCEAIEAEQMRRVRRKEKDEIKEDVIQEMLPHAFPRNKRVYGYLALNDGLLVVDASNAKIAEDFASTLRKSLGSLPVRPPVVEQAPAFTFTGWLSESIELPDQITLGADAWMADPSQDGGKVIARGLDLNSDEVRGHLDAGMQATKLTMTWDDNVSFCLDEEFGITRLRFGDTFHEKLDDIDADDAAARFDAAFSLMTMELSRMIPALLDVLGGEDRSAITEEAVSEAPPPSRQGDDDALYPQAVSLVAATQKATIPSIQRHFRIGFNRAANMIEEMEDHGLISRPNGEGVREVYIEQPPSVATA
ncbi:recombination-associated protein RdgC [Marinobacter sp. C18]|uniref:recombination-associated protein RdgC n=1 Tax=Marinobacter sp. C18 TaxID=1772288 RepID=UPI0009F86C64|nr:recombination-associated protein RdgC [Marinobacter sp. C18]